MANTSLLGTAWSARLLFNLYNTLQFGNIVNTEYEGDAANSAAVRINSLGAITVGDYTASIGVGTPEDLVSTSQDLLIDQHKFFNFKVEDLTKIQTNIGVVDAAMADAALQLSNAIDAYIGGKYTELSAINGTGSLALTSSNAAYDFIVDTAVALDEAKVPKGNRFIVCPAFVGGMLSKDTRYVWKSDVMTTGIAPAIRIADMEVYFSNNVAVVNSVYKVIAGDKRAIAYVGALRNMEAARSTTHFADVVRGQVVFGAKVVKPAALVLTNITK